MITVGGDPAGQKLPMSNGLGSPVAQEFTKTLGSDKRPVVSDTIVVPARKMLLVKLKFAICLVVTAPIENTLLGRKHSGGPCNHRGNLWDIRPRVKPVRARGFARAPCRNRIVSTIPIVVVGEQSGIGSRGSYICARPRD